MGDNSVIQLQLPANRTDPGQTTQTDARPVRKLIVDGKADLSGARLQFVSQFFDFLLLLFFSLIVVAFN